VQAGLEQALGSKLVEPDGTLEEIDRAFKVNQEKP
jgi:hypothetical protein